MSSRDEREPLTGGAWLGFCEGLTGLEGQRARDAVFYLVMGVVLFLVAVWMFQTVTDPQFWVEMWESLEQCEADPDCRHVAS